MTRDEKLRLVAIGGAILLIGEGLRRMGEEMQAGAIPNTPDFSAYLGQIGSGGGSFKNTGSGSNGSPDAGQGGGVVTKPLPPLKNDPGAKQPEPVPDVSTGGRLDRKAARALVEQTISRFGFRVDPAVAAAIVMVESGGRVDAVGDRDVPTGPAYGLMQVLRVTSEWLYQDLNYRAYPPGSALMASAQAGAYYGCAYLNWLGSYGGRARDRNWIIQSYNAGPGNSSGGYLNKVLAEMAAQGAGV